MLGDAVQLLTRHRQLTWELTKRELGERHAGQAFGRLWAVGHPLVLMFVYVVIFAYVFKLKVGGTREMPLDYATFLLSGLIPWMAFQDVMSKSSTVIAANATLVKQVVFPLEVLPVKSVLASFFTQAIATGVLIVYVVVRHQTLPSTYALVPVLYLFQALAMAGVAYLIAAAAVFVRDLREVVQVFCVIGMYVMPVFYLPQWVPDLLRPVLYGNPFSYLAWCYQDACYFGRFEHPLAWVVFPTGAVLVFVLGYRFFSRVKIMFGNVL